MRVCVCVCVSMYANFETTLDACACVCVCVCEGVCVCVCVKGAQGSRSMDGQILVGLVPGKRSGPPSSFIALFLPSSFFFVFLFASLSLSLSLSCSFGRGFTNTPLERGKTLDRSSKKCKVVFSPPGLCRGPCAPRRGRGGRRWSRRADPESSAHSWPNVESTEKKTNKQTKRFVNECGS